MQNSHFLKRVRLRRESAGAGSSSQLTELTDFQSAGLEHDRNTSTEPASVITSAELFFCLTIKVRHVNYNDLKNEKTLMKKLFRCQGGTCRALSKKEDTHTHTSPVRCNILRCRLCSFPPVRAECAQQLTNLTFPFCVVYFIRASSVNARAHINYAQLRARAHTHTHADTHAHSPSPFFGMSPLGHEAKQAIDTLRFQLL